MSSVVGTARMMGSTTQGDKACGPSALCCGGAGLSGEEDNWSPTEDTEEESAISDPAELHSSKYLPALCTTRARAASNLPKPTPHAEFAPPSAEDGDVLDDFRELVVVETVCNVHFSIADE